MNALQILAPFCLLFLLSCDSSFARNAGQQAGFGRNSGQSNGQNVNQNAGQYGGQHVGQQAGQPVVQDSGEHHGQEVSPKSGHENGQTQGHEDGPNSSHKDSQNSGHEDGPNSGHDDGQNSGHEDGQNSGHEDGPNSGHEDGQNSGHKGGQNSGHEDIRNSSDSSSANANTTSVGYVIYDPKWAKAGIGGQLANEGQFPYVVWLAIDVGNKVVGSCGGGLIGIPKNGQMVYAVLTAAHCFNSSPKNSEVTITMGTTDATQQSSTKKIVRVPIGSVVNYPEYDKGTHVNDIAVIRLPSDFKLSAGISTLPIPDAGQENTELSGIPVIFAGWGRNNEHSYVKNPKLVFFTTKVMTDKECADGLRRFNTKYSNTLICLDGTDMKGSCQGDSGGPVARTEAQDKPLQIIGVSSFRITEYCMGHTPTYYTRVAAYVDWIKQNV